MTNKGHLLYMPMSPPPTAEQISAICSVCGVALEQLNKCFPETYEYRVYFKDADVTSMACQECDGWFMRTWFKLGGISPNFDMCTRTYTFHKRRSSDAS